MDKITKFLLKLSVKERDYILYIIGKIFSLKLDGLDIKKLQGKSNFFRIRIRKGKIRVIFKIEGSKGKIIDINYRDKIYN